MSMRCPRWGWTRPTWPSAWAYRPAAPMPRGRGGPGGVPGVVTMPQVTCGSPSVPRLRWRGRCGRRSSSGTGTSARSTCSWVWSRSIPMSGRCWPCTACRTRCSSAGLPRRAPRDDPRSSRCGGAAKCPDHVDLALTKTECQSTRRWAAMSLDDRKLDVLRAIVEDYVATQEPVGSKALVDRHHLGVSPATIRNDMAVLEEEGYIAQPHTSAGRVPTDKGYRLFVDRLSTVKPLSPAEKRAIQTFLDGAVDLDDVVTRTVRLLAQLTRQVAVVQYPSLTRSTVRHVELVPLAATRVLLVLITDTGRVEQRVVELPHETDDVLLGDLRARLGHAVAGLDTTAVASAVERLPESFSPTDRKVVAAVAATLLESLVDKHDERLAVAGTANLARYGQGFDQVLEPLLEALEEHVVLLRLLGEATSPSTLTVRIGHENADLSAASVITTGYGPGERALASMGVVGPTRMDYPGTIAAVGAVARYVSQILAGNN